MVARPPNRLPPKAVPFPLAVDFTAGDITGLRQKVDELARRHGLDEDRAGDWVTAVNELMINVVRHGGGVGRIRVWLDSHLVCEVADRGPGFTAAAYLGRSDRPPPSATGGMGLWIVQQTTDELWIDSGPTGTTVRITAATPPQR